jgi:hypothetical protein
MAESNKSDWYKGGKREVRLAEGGKIKSHSGGKHEVRLAEMQRAPKCRFAESVISGPTKGR